MIYARREQGESDRADQECGVGEIGRWLDDEMEGLEDERRLRGNRK
jgi:hypothetical protein